MVDYIRNYQKNVRLAHCKRALGEIAVISGLAVTPAQMYSLSSRGVPVSTTTATNFYDGVENPSWTLPLEYRRGIDVAQLWQESKRVRAKVAAADSKSRSVSSNVS